MKVINNEYKPHRGLGKSDADWEVLKEKVRAFLRTKAADSTVPEEEVRAVDLQLRDDQVWVQLAADLGLQMLPGDA